jgi:hypothetical protein
MKVLLLGAILVLLLGRAISELSAKVVEIDGSSKTDDVAKPKSKQQQRPPSKESKGRGKKEAKGRIHPVPPLPVARDKMTMFDPDNTTIFISIASYRDPELNATLVDLFGKAQYPGMLRVTVLLQEDEAFLERGEGGGAWYPQELLSRGGEINILPRNYKEAKGAGEARATIQKRYNNETFYMQLDSHHRFARNWDTTVISKLTMLERFSKKPGGSSLRYIIHILSTVHNCAALTLTPLYLTPEPQSLASTLVATSLATARKRSRNPSKDDPSG